MDENQKKGPIIIQTPQTGHATNPENTNKIFSEADMKAFGIFLIEQFIPQRAELDGFPYLGSDVEKMEWGMIKQEQIEREVCLRVISDLNEHIINFKHTYKL